MSKDRRKIMGYNQKKEKVEELSKLIEINSNKVDTKSVSKINELQERLQFNLKSLEEQGLDKKIETMEKVLKILKDEKKTIIT